MSKFSLDVLQQRVFPFVHTDDPDVILGATFGEDVALTRVGGDILASHLDPIVGAIGNIGWLAVHVACNDIATSGIPPRWILPLVLVPRPEDEDLLERIMRDASQAAKEVGASIIGGHTGYSANLTRPLVAVTALGAASGREPLRTRGARVGDRVLVTKGIALEGTAILAQDFADVARELGLSESDLAEARRLMAEVSVVPEALAVAAQGASAMHDVTRGGLLETLLEIASLSGVAIEVDASMLPVPPIVSRFAKAFQFDPLWMISSGTLAMTVPPVYEYMANTATFRYFASEPSNEVTGVWAISVNICAVSQSGDTIISGTPSSSHFRSAMSTGSVPRSGTSSSRPSSSPPPFPKISIFSSVWPEQK